jgi:hypothetical protein
MKELKNANCCKLRSERRESRRPKSLSVGTRAMISRREIIREISLRKRITPINKKRKIARDRIGLIG